jgi:hypothetical protein
MDTFTHTFREILRAENLKVRAVAERGACDPAYLRRLVWGEKANPSAQTCEQIGYAIGAVRGLDYDAMVGVPNEPLVAAGYQPLRVQRRRRRAS